MTDAVNNAGEPTNVVPFQPQPDRVTTAELKLQNRQLLHNLQLMTAESTKVLKRLNLYEKTMLELNIPLPSGDMEQEMEPVELDFVAYMMDDKSRTAIVKLPSGRPGKVLLPSAWQSNTYLQFQQEGD